jgi:hypothetical protein
MDVLDILADSSRHSKIEDEELYTFLNQFLVKHKSFNILNPGQEAAVCTAIKRRYVNAPPPPKTRDLVNKLDQQRTSEEDKKASLVDIFRRAGLAATASIEAVKDMYRRKGVSNGNVPLTEADILAVLKYMSSTFSDFEARQEQSWNAENFGKVTAQSVCLIQLFVFANEKMPNLDWAAILMELGRSNFHFPDLERFNFLISIYRAAGKSSSFTLRTLLEWPDFAARFSAVRILIRVQKEIFDVLEQSEEHVLSINDFVSASPLIKEKAAFLATQNLNSLDLCHTFFQLSHYNDDPQAIALLREEFRNNVELLTLAGLELPVLIPLRKLLIGRNHGQVQQRHLYSVDFNISSGLKEHISFFSQEHIKSIQHSSQNYSCNISQQILKQFQESAILHRRSRFCFNYYVFDHLRLHLN